MTGVTRKRLIGILLGSLVVGIAIPAATGYNFWDSWQWWVLSISAYAAIRLGIWGYKQ